MNFIISILLSIFSVFKNWGKYTIKVSNPVFSTHLSKQFKHSFLITKLLSAKLGMRLKAIFFV